MPTTGELIGLGYARRNAATPGTRLEVAESGWADIVGLAPPFGPGKDYG